jgi:two-component system chemotaxis response regulator CheY
MKILIVDDDFNFCKILSEFLGGLGNNATANNGYEAIEKFLAALENNDPFDLICLDVMMNDLDGLKSLNILRRVEKIKKVEAAKLIFITALDEDELTAIAGDSIKELGGSYLQKPVTRKKVLNAVQKLGFKVD